MLRLSSTANLNFPPTSEKLNQLEPSGARLINWDSLRSFLPALVLPFSEVSTPHKKNQKFYTNIDSFQEEERKEVRKIKDWCFSLFLSKNPENQNCVPQSAEMEGGVVIGKSKTRTHPFTRQKLSWYEWGSSPLKHQRH